jgi:MYXO-CTERM domain-containing protein
MSGNTGGDAGATGAGASAVGGSGTSGGNGSGGRVVGGGGDLGNGGSGEGTGAATSATGARSSNGGNDAGSVCIPGDQKSCACPGEGNVGIQVCDDSGNRYGSCECPEPKGTSGGGDDKGGCGCRAPSREPAPRQALWLALLALLLPLRRRRRA